MNVENIVGIYSLLKIQYELKNSLYLAERKELEKKV